MDTLIVEAFSNKYGPSFLCEKVWHVADKTLNPNLTCKMGDKVEVERNGKWVKSFRIVGSGTPPPTQEAPQKAQESPKKAYTHSPEVQGQICRGNSCNAILGSPAVAEMLKNQGMDEAFQSIMNMVDKTAKYIGTGEWK